MKSLCFSKWIPGRLMAWVVFFFLCLLLSLCVAHPILSPIEEGLSFSPLLLKSARSEPQAIRSHKAEYIFDHGQKYASKPPELKRFTCLTIGTRGDVQPYIALCQRLQEDGHTCTIATHKVFEGLIKGYGIGFAEIAGDPAELIKHCIEHGMLSISFWWKGYHRFKDWFAGLTQSAWVACQNTDVLIESPSTFVGVHIAQSKGIDYIRAFTMPWTKTTEYPHAFAVPPYDLGGWYNKFSYKVFDYVIWKALSSPINAWRKADLSLAKTSLSKLNIERIPFLYNFSPKIVPKASDWGENTVVTGYWFTKPKSGEIEELDHELQRAIKKAKNEDKKVVYIGFGSVIVPDPGKVTDAVTGALEENKNIFAVVSGGWTSNDNEAESSMLNAFRKYKDSIYYVKSVPHESLFPKIDAALHHGGAGTTAASMRAGIYTMIHPFFGDQYFWAQRVESLRIGKHVKALTMKDIDLALKEVLKISSENSNSKSIGEDIRNEDGVSVAAKAIYKFLDNEASKVHLKPRETKWSKLSALKSFKHSPVIYKPWTKIILKKLKEAFLVFRLKIHHQIF